VAKFFLMCESYIGPDMRIKIPPAMMAKEYSSKESKNRTLQMQVRREVENIRGLDPPRPPKAVAAAATALLTNSFGLAEHDESHSCNDYSQCSPRFG
jgi:hypothetical protein